MTQKNMLTCMKMAEIAVEFRYSKNRLLLLDYDGTLVNIQSSPDKVIPSEKILNVLKETTLDDRNTVVIITGRDKEYIHKWFGNMNLYIFAEHGSLMKPPGKEWIILYNGSQEWKQKILPIINSFTERNHGSIMEEKVSSIAWHYRNVNPDIVFETVEELYTKLKENISSDMNLTILEGKKIIEVKQIGFDKGSACIQMLGLKDFQFILSIGDDLTDEDMFKVLPNHAHSFKVGHGPTWAKMNIENTKEVMRILESLN